MPAHLTALFPLPLGARGISYTCVSLLKHMESADFEISLVVPKTHLPAPPSFVRPSAPFPLSRLPFRYFERYFTRSYTTALLHEAASASAVYLWSEIPIALSRRLSELAVPVIREKFNSHKSFSNSVLRAAYDRLGWPCPALIPDDLLDKEHEELALADYVFVSNPHAARSLLEQGVPERKLLRSSYGWDPERIRTAPRTTERAGPLVYLFVGRACVRKGVPFLLDAWRRAETGGKLLLVGDVDPELLERCPDLLGQDSVALLGHIDDISPVYESADVFVFPSLEEGGPLVTIEAMAQGLPSIVSSMGGSGVMRNGLDGLEVDPFDVDAMASALRSMAEDGEMRTRFGVAAQQQALHFTWEQVGRRRRLAILEALAARRSDATRPVAASGDCRAGGRDADRR